MPNLMDYAAVQMDYLNHRTCTPQWRIIPKRTHFIDITYVVAGSATYYINGRTVKVHAGQLLCIPKGTMREASANPDDLMECYCMNFFLQDYRTGEDIVLPFPLVSEIGEHPQLIRLFSSLCQTWLIKESGYILKTRAHAMYILSELFSILRYEHQVTNADTRVRRVIAYMTQNLGGDLTVNHLAELAQLNPVYFCALFRKSMGVSVNQYVRQLRMNQAEALLEEGSSSVSEIAEVCGYNDVYYFSRLFKQHKGVPPSSIRKKK